MDRHQKIEYITNNLQYCSDITLGQLNRVIKQEINLPTWMDVADVISLAFTNRKQMTDKLVNMLQYVSDNGIDRIYNFVADNT